MPTYEYECDKCRRVFEVRQRISEPALTICDVCGGALRRLLSPAPFILKGDGWYVTDYPSASRKKALEAEKSATSPASAPDKTGDKSADKGGDKTADKAGTKRPAKSESKSGDGSSGTTSSAGASTPSTPSSS
jgi:putative FmdB family regulatory protein